MRRTNLVRIVYTKAKATQRSIDTDNDCEVGREGRGGMGGRGGGGEVDGSGRGRGEEEGGGCRREGGTGSGGGREGGREGGRVVKLLTDVDAKGCYLRQ